MFPSRKFQARQDKTIDSYLNTRTLTLELKKLPLIGIEDNFLY